MIVGYKCFNKGLINKYGIVFEVGKCYHVDGEIKFGDKGNGFHMCLNLEDTLRYFDGFNEEIEICEVYGFGKVREFFDDYNEYYNLYSCEYLLVLRVLDREEIIKIMLESNYHNTIRFIQGFKLTNSELELFKRKYNNDKMIFNTIKCYQKQDCVVNEEENDLSLVKIRKTSNNVE